MRSFRSMMMLGVLACASAAAADYSVGIAGLGMNSKLGLDTGTGLNLYSISNKGVDLVKGSPFVLQKTDPQGHLYLPALVSMSPTRDFVYVEYVGLSLPYIVGFEITAKGLVYQWAAVAQDAGDISVASIVAGRNYVVVNSYPSGPWAEIINQSGQEVASEGSDGEFHVLTGVRVASNGNFYYACRYESTKADTTDAAANTVRVYKFPNGALEGYASQPVDPTLLVTSTDPVFVQSECAE